MKIRVIDPALTGRTWSMHYACLDCGRIVEITEMTLAEYQAEQHRPAVCPECAAKRRESDR
jgi:DNA-directed RNA polymerase subunit RPC12/RpoP